MEPVVIEGASVILPDRLAKISVRIENGVIAALDGPRDLSLIHI